MFVSRHSLLALTWCGALLMAAALVDAAPTDDAHDVADALRILQELDRYYAQAARPRIDRRDAYNDQVNPELLDRALRLLQLQTLDNYYSYHTRPRFGKRSGNDFDNWARKLEKLPESMNWLNYARRR